MFKTTVAQSGDSHESFWRGGMHLKQSLSLQDVEVYGQGVPDEAV